MQRFYIKDLHLSKNTFSLGNKNIVYQLVKVLRIQIGVEIILFNGEKNIDYVYEVVDFSKKEIFLKLKTQLEKDSELKFKIHLFQALPNKLDKLEYVIQKGVEAGISKFVFYRSERSQKLHITDKKEERLHKILIEAIEQSGRNTLPDLEFCIGEVCIDALDGESIFLHTKNENSQGLRDYIKHRDSIESVTSLDCINLYIGPEGGFSDGEVKDFEKREFSRIHLGNRILRTETAGVVTAFTLGQML